MSALSICLVQFDIGWEDPASNHKRVERLLPASADPFDLVLLPEMFNTGYTMEAARNAQSIQGESVAWMKEISSEHRCDVMGSLIIKEGFDYYNRLLYIHKGEIHSHYDKRHLFAFAGEHESFKPGEDRVTLQIGGLNCMPLICYDLRFPVWSRNPGNVDTLIYVANFPAKRKYAWRQLLIARAIENQCYVVGLNRIGVDGNEHPYSGDSMVIDPYGHILHDMEDREESLVVTLEKGDIEKCRQHLPFLADRDQFTFA